MKVSNKMAGNITNIIELCFMNVFTLIVKFIVHVTVWMKIECTFTKRGQAESSKLHEKENEVLFNNPI